MAALGKASRVLLPLAVAVAALSLAVFSGREASRHLGGGAPSLEVLSSGLDQMRSFVGDLLYLKIDRYHHIWMYQGHEWEQATDYLPMIWLVNRHKPENARNYIDGGHHLAINLERDTPGARFWQRNYYEHIVRNRRELNAIRVYIRNNPRKWALDRDHPDHLDY